MDGRLLRGFAIVILFASTAYASVESIGANGIDSAGLTLFGGGPLNGQGVSIGQVELNRPGSLVLDTNPAAYNTFVAPAFVFWRQNVTPANFNVTANSIYNPTTNPTGEIDNHPEEVAGVMISTATGAPITTPAGVAPAATLYSVGVKPDPTDALLDSQQSAFSSQHLVDVSGGTIRTINMSFGITYYGTHQQADGNSLLTLYVDWSAHFNDVLYVSAGNELHATGHFPFPTDNFNGITVAASERVAGVFRRVASFNTYAPDDFSPGDRTSTDIIAPGDTLDLTGLGNTVPSTPKPSGTSFAAPHVAAAAALLQQYGNDRHSVAAAGFTNLDYSFHQVTKAVLMNSADKFIDNGTVIPPGQATPVPVGGLLGMSKTVVMQDGTSTWFNSNAYDKDPTTGGLIPLDKQMGTGALNARRALQQFQGGEFSRASAVPVIGWDYGLTGGTPTRNVYAFNQQLVGGSFASITLCWDRMVTFATDTGATNHYDLGDTFNESTDPTTPGHDQFSDLALWLLPFGSTSTSAAIAESDTGSGTVEHIFWEIPTTGRYEVWVTQHNNNGGSQVNYGLAWWGEGTGPIVALGDFDQSGRTDVGDVQSAMSALSDLDKYKSTHGGLSDQDLLAIGDIDGDGAVTNLDLQALIVQIANTSGGGSISPVPEPSSIILLMIGAVGLAARRRRRAPAKNEFKKSRFVPRTSSGEDTGVDGYCCLWLYTLTLPSGRTSLTVPSR
jgi:hypothetical protein